MFQIVTWATLILTGPQLNAAKKPLYDGLGRYSRKIKPLRRKRSVISIRDPLSFTDLITAQRFARFGKQRSSIYQLQAPTFVSCRPDQESRHKSSGWRSLSVPVRLQLGENAK